MENTHYFEYKIDTSGNSIGMQFKDVGTEILGCWITAGHRFEAREKLVETLKGLGISSCCIWISETVVSEVA